MIRAGLCGAAVLGLAAAAAAQEPARFRAELKEHDALTYDITSKVATQSGRGERSLEQKARVRLVVVKVDAQGAATVRMAFETLGAKLLREGAQADFRWGGGEVQAGDSPLGAICAELVKGVYELTISPAGEITGVSIPDKVLQAGAEKGERNTAGVLGVFGPESAKRQLAPLFTLDPARAERRPGESWSTPVKMDVLPGVEAVMTTTYRFESARDGTAELSASSDLDLSERDSATKDVDPQLAIGEQQASARLKWDLKQARLLERRAESRITLVATLNTQPPTKAESTTRLETSFTFVSAGQEPPAPRQPDPAPPGDPARL
jgi:hypothetical protein